MKTFSYHSAIALSALLLGACGGANSVVAPSSVQMHNGSKTASTATGQTEGVKKAAWNALSDADKAAKKAAMQARKAAWDALSDDEKSARPLRKSMMGGKKAAWNALSDADKAAKKAAMQARKAAWNALSDTDKAAKKAAKKASWLDHRAIVGR